ncbi:MAG TPA: hypothetical protein VFG09_08265 [Thermodesulfovibrionales bacterium]|nr:hypothetical protein [Thermodesulfovibrionales bacterium]
MATSRFVMIAVTLFLVAIVPSIAMAEDVITITGTVKGIDLTTNTIIVTTNEGKDVAITVEDNATLDKFRKQRIKVDDDVRVKYKVRDGKNVSTSFRKSSGC